jgi:hypothetical protein
VSLPGAVGSTCAVYVYREGALSAIGHDLKLLVTDFTLEVGEDLAIRASARTGSLKVAGVLHGANRGDPEAVDEREPGARDRKEIERNIVRDVLEADRFPVATFRSTAVEVSGEGYRISGQLELHGVARDLSFAVERQGSRAVARFPLLQPDFRIKPYRALLGALKVKPEIMIEVIGEVTSET